MYSDLYLKSRSKTPPILFAIAIIAVLGFFVSFSHLPQAPIRASKEQALQIKLVNLAPRDVGIFWETSEKTVGWVISGETEGSLNTTTLDERDIENNRTSSKYHFVHLRNLNESTTYYYKLVSAKGVIAGPDDKPFHLTTPNNISPITSVDPVYGTTITSNGTPAVNTIVQVTYPGAYSLMALAKIDGAWLTPISYLFSTTDNKLIAPDENAPITIEMYNDDQVKTTVKTTLHGAAPLPQTIILGTDYDLTAPESVLPAATSAAKITTPKSIQILFPKEKAIVPGQNPLIKGTALAGGDVSVKINTLPPTSFTVQADQKGLWTVTDPITIKAGDYKMTVSTTDTQGKLVSMVRSFSIAKSGEQVLAAASGPATLTPTVGPTLAPTATVAPLPTATPQPTLSVATATPAPPVSGVNPMYMLGGSVLLIAVGAGLMLFL